MKIVIKEASYNRGYVIGPYLQERPGVNADIILEEGEDQEECTLKAMHYLKSIADKFHVQANPHLYQEGVVPLPADYVKFDKVAVHAPNSPYSIPTISKDSERAEISIDNAETLADLQLLEEEAGKYGLLTQYIIKFNELNNGRPTEFTQGL